MSDDTAYMKRAIEIAQLGRYTVAPNPRVGCVIVCQNNIIGEGFHKHYGEAHAEVNAINSVKDMSMLKESTLYVTLEPCSHHGKTPPCSDLIIKHKIPKVVIANADPFAEVNGNGIRRLESHGVDVSLGILKKEGEELNKRFLSFYKKNRPYIVLKFAKSQDGFLARNKENKHLGNWISGKRAKELVHLWRSEEQAILIGKNTALEDNPLLTCREVDGSNPIRIVIDAQLELPQTLNIFNTDAKTIILNKKINKTSGKIRWVKMEMDESLIKELMAFCYENKILSVLVEGGANILSQFLKTNYWDEARIFKGQRVFNNGVKAPHIKNTPIVKRMVEEDELFIFKNTFE